MLKSIILTIFCVVLFSFCSQSREENKSHEGVPDNQELTENQQRISGYNNTRARELKIIYGERGELTKAEINEAAEMCASLMDIMADKLIVSDNPDKTLDDFEKDYADGLWLFSFALNNKKFLDEDIYNKLMDADIALTNVLNSI